MTAGRDAALHYWSFVAGYVLVSVAILSGVGLVTVVASAGARRRDERVRPVSAAVSRRRRRDSARGVGLSSPAQGPPSLRGGAPSFGPRRGEPEREPSLRP